MKKSWVLIILLVVVCVAIIAAFFFQRNRRQYELVAPKIGPINEAIYGIGTVVSKNKFSFKVATPKTITELYTQQGQVVRKGDPLFKFDDGLSVKSPLDGVVISLPYNKGENVFTDHAVIEVEDQNSVFIEVSLDQQSSMRVKVGQNTRISFETLEGTIFNGRVDSLYHSKNGFIAKVENEVLPKQILPGMTADVAIEVAQKDSATLIPARSIQLGYVLIQRNGKQEKIKVTLGIMDKDWVEVTSGSIQKDDLILIKRSL